jgi:hypothetical protein
MPAIIHEDWRQALAEVRRFPFPPEVEWIRRHLLCLLAEPANYSKRYMNAYCSYMEIRHGMSAAEALSLTPHRAEELIEADVRLILDTAAARPGADPVAQPSTQEPVRRKEPVTAVEVNAIMERELARQGNDPDEVAARTVRQWAGLTGASNSTVNKAPLYRKWQEHRQRLREERKERSRERGNGRAGICSSPCSNT